MSGSSYQVQSTGVMNTIRAGWERLAYRHKFAEATLYLMFVSGLILWDVVEANWEIERIMLVSHLIAGLTIFPLIVGLFWASHRNLMAGSKKRFLRTTGRLVEILLTVCTVSGVYLMLYGKPRQPDRSVDAGYPFLQFDVADPGCFPPCHALVGIENI